MVPGYIVNICREISEKLALETGLDSLSFYDGVLDLSEIVEEIQISALECMFEKKVQDAESFLSLKYGMNANISFDSISKGVYEGSVNAPESFRNNLASRFASAMGISSEEASRFEFVNNSLCFKTSFAPSEDSIAEFVREKISDSFSTIRNVLQTMVEAGTISSFSVSKDYRARFTFPPNERISEDCENTLLEEISSIVKKKGHTPSTMLRKKTLDDGRFLGVEVEDSLVGIIISKNRSSVSITGSVVEEEIPSELGSVVVPSNTISNDSVIDCEYIRSNLRLLLRGLKL
jgi:hypothetical protein